MEKINTGEEKAVIAQRTRTVEGSQATGDSVEPPITCVVCQHLAVRYGVYDWRCTENCGCPTMIGCIAPSGSPASAQAG